MENAKVYLPPLEKEEGTMRKKRRFDPVVVCAAVILSASLVCHGWLVSRLISSLPGNALSEFLTSQILPDYTFAEKGIALQYYEAEILPILKEETSPGDFVTKDLSANAENGFVLTNQTGYEPDLYELYSSPAPIDTRDKLYERYLEGEPLVLVYHTHATESYSDTNESGTFRSADPEKNVVSVGEVLCKTLEKAGIPSVHMTELFDAESYNDAYYNSSSAVADFLREHPSVQYVIDLHRDCIMTEDGKYVSAAFTDDFTGLSFAQLMFVVGTDEGGSGHTGWENNLTVALQLQKRIHDDYPSLMRPLNLRSASFYQHTSPGAMLVEFGCCGNTLSDAKNSAVLFGVQLAGYILGENQNMEISAIIEELC